MFSRSSDCVALCASTSIHGYCILSESSFCTTPLCLGVRSAVQLVALPEDEEDFSKPFSYFDKLASNWSLARYQSMRELRPTFKTLPATCVTHVHDYLVRKHALHAKRHRQVLQVVPPRIQPNRRYSQSKRRPPLPLLQVGPHVQQVTVPVGSLVLDESQHVTHPFFVSLRATLAHIADVLHVPFQVARRD